MTSFPGHPLCPLNPYHDSIFESRIPPYPDLSSALSSLNSLISESRHTLKALSTLLSLPPKPPNPNHVVCPFNPHHLMPPESLFFHSLHCPSSPSPPINTAVLDSLHYPKTLSHDHQLLFTQELHEPCTELCFSLDDYYANFSSNFFFNDCPAVVSSFDLQDSKRMLTLPGVLLKECANFVVRGEGDVNSTESIGSGIKVLPSELWVIRGEVQGWGWNYPFQYSFGVACAILGLKMVKEGDLKRWIISNSPRFGVIIDTHMRDHTCVLFRLSYKAIVREGKFVLNNYLNEQIMEVREKASVNFRCPVLSQVLTWLASQLSILYGQMNGKCFVIEIFKQSLLEAASQVRLFPLENNSRQSHISDAESSQVESSSEPSVDKQMGECLDNGVVFVSQVAAAVSAVHERSLLEEKIKPYHVSQQGSRHQWVFEHSCLSSKADEERKKRSTYRPIIDHDGLPRHGSSNQDSGKAKTKEELLAEERDYKRRRMSYRGKKVKRTTKQVMRDIIEEYMEEIKQAGGIGHFEKRAEDLPKLPSCTSDIDGQRSFNADSSEASKSISIKYEKHSPCDFQDHKRNKRVLEGNNGLSGNKKSKHSDSRHEEYSSESRESYRRHEQSNQRRHAREAAVEVTRTPKHEIGQRSSVKSKDYVDDRKTKSGRTREMSRYHSSDSTVDNVVEDRYDPSESRDNKY